MLKNVRFTAGTSPLEAVAVQKAIDLGNEKLGQDGRLLIRKSGTEPLIRVMGESLDPDLLEHVVNDIAQAVVDAG
jgi:phosphoglucosamine mutase